MTCWIRKMDEAARAAAPAVLAAFLAATWSGCVSTPRPAGSGPEDAAGSSAIDLPVQTYYQYEYQDRLYVIGTPERAVEFEETGRLPHVLTRIGAGPSGETVVVEIDRDRPELRDLLWREFERRNLYYAEERLEEALVVLGNRESHRRLLASGEPPECRPLDEGEARGLAVWIEADEDNPVLYNRLALEYRERHAHGSVSSKETGGAP